MWRKVKSLARVQGRLSLPCLLAFQKREFRNGKDAMRRGRGGWRGGVEAAITRQPPGRRASLWLAISVVLNLGDEGSAGPSLNRGLS